ncbi:DNA-binding transcriptional activator [Pedobacter ginsengisoli]|uniref:DNA-binding transcriptional activator n=1 Tax=Pedobacter ginsengisoli TaxID=363852 RepID=A0A2D1UBF8_9SPHI|nr:kelch repeat-containing protein [Pedobacter ginsengisoli]ATP58925.1 DNA-binding transcriptional activator [Pedobacter ginsengisoli]
MTFKMSFAQGLAFKGEGVGIDKRGSYDVFDKKSLVFAERFELNFQLSYPDYIPFGYIFSLVDQPTNQAYNLIYLTNDRKGYLKFNLEGKENLATFELDQEKLLNKDWFNVSIFFLLQEKRIVIKIDGKSHSITKTDLAGTFIPSLVFGLNKNSVDVPTYAIRNLTVKGGNKHYFFPLNESKGSFVHNEQGEIIGKVNNPVWIINNAYYWKKRFVFKSRKVSGSNFDKQRQSMLFFDSDSITYLNLRNYTTSSARFYNVSPVTSKLGTNFFDAASGHLYSYEVVAPFQGAGTIAMFDMNQNRWEAISQSTLGMQLHHHAGYFDKKRNRYLIFGGFGNQKYNGETFAFDLDKKIWDTLSLKGDRILPRYFTSLACDTTKESLYVFGGAGNESGDQTLGRRYFYDLYRVDLRNQTIRKMWDLSWDKGNMVPTRNMVIANDTSLYALCYPEYIARSALKLYKFSIRNGTHQIFGDSIPIFSDKIATNACLYYNATLKEFYCTVQEFEDNGFSVTTLYSLSAPPIEYADLLMYKPQRSLSLQWIFISFVIFCAAMCILFSRKYLKKHRVQKPSVAILKAPEKQMDRANAIYLFGQFILYDRRGKDITYLLSNRLKQTFLLILQYSFGDGISSAELSEKIWPGKEDLNVKNLRGVTLNQLRKVLQELDGIELVFDKGNFRIKMQESCYCDLAELNQLMADQKGNKNTRQIHHILQRGDFLFGVEFPATDLFKESVRAKLADKFFE